MFDNVNNSDNIVEKKVRKYAVIFNNNEMLNTVYSI